MHLADAFIQSDLQCIQVIHFIQYVCSLGIEPRPFALLTQCSTTEPQEQFLHYMPLTELLSFIHKKNLFHIFFKYLCMQNK